MANQLAATSEAEGLAGAPRDAECPSFGGCTSALEKDGFERCQNRVFVTATPLPNAPETIRDILSHVATQNDPSGSRPSWTQRY